MTAVPAASPFMLSSRFMALVIATTQNTTMPMSSHQAKALLK
jgi:hypothetical protein